MNAFEIAWQAPEFEHRPKDISWYWISIIVSVIFVGAAVWQKNFLFGFFLIVAELLILVWGNREPAMIDFKLTEKGLTIAGRKFYPLLDIRSFSVDQDAPVWSSIVFHFKRSLEPAVKVHIAKNRVSEIQNYLRSTLTEVEREESLIETLEKFFGF